MSRVRRLRSGRRAQAPRVRSIEGAVCHHCGCTDLSPCPGGCSWRWVDRARGLGLCSECAGRFPVTDGSSVRALNVGRDRETRVMKVSNQHTIRFDNLGPGNVRIESARGLLPPVRFDSRGRLEKIRRAQPLRGAVLLKPGETFVASRRLIAGSRVVGERPRRGRKETTRP